jgi:hypothetical protein
MKIAKRLSDPRSDQDAMPCAATKLGAAAVREARFAEEIARVKIQTKKASRRRPTDVHIQARHDARGARDVTRRSARRDPWTPAMPAASWTARGVIVTTAERAKADTSSTCWARARVGVVGVDRRRWASGRCRRSVKCLANAASREKVEPLRDHRGFAAQYLGSRKELGLERDKVNVNGGAISLGHPLGWRPVRSCSRSSRAAPQQKRTASPFGCMRRPGHRLLVEKPAREMNSLVHLRRTVCDVVLVSRKRVLFLTIGPRERSDASRRRARPRMDEVGRALHDFTPSDDARRGWMLPHKSPRNLRPRPVTRARDGSASACSRTRALMDGNFQVIVSGQRKGTGSSRDDRPQAEKWLRGSSVVIAASFRARFTSANNLNLGHDRRLRTCSATAAWRGDPLAGFTEPYDRQSAAAMLEAAAFPFRPGSLRRGARARAGDRGTAMPWPEKILPRT